MKKKSTWQSGFLKLRVSLTLLLFSAGVFLALLGSGLFAAAEEQQAPRENSGIQFGVSYHNDVSPALRDLAVLWPPPARKDGDDEEALEANLNPKLPLPEHIDVPDPVVERDSLLKTLVPDIPSPILNFNGIPFPGVGCNCAPPDTNGAVGLNQYVQMVNEGYQVFNKATGASILGPTVITAIWSGFGGVCESNGRGDPVVLYDHMANRWLISQFAGSPPTDECVAISTTSDATGTYNRYGFHLGSNFFDYPHLGVWPDGYYMAMNVFNSAGTAFLGPQAFAFDRAKMLAGLPATFVTPGITGGSSEPSFLPSDLDGAITPPAGTRNPFVSFPGAGVGVYKVRLFHADFVTPGNTTFNLIGNPAAAGFTMLCPTTRNCVPQLGTTSKLDGIGDRLMFRLAYRKFTDGHEAVVGNYTVSAGGVAGVRWFELRAVTTVPVVFQEGTYQPDTTWRWMGSAGMDQSGNMALGFSASSDTINPQIRYAGRLVTDPINTLGQGEATLFSGTGSQTGTGSRWGDYSALTVDPVDDCTFWYTQEYYATTGSFNWRTRIGSFKFSTCPAGPTPTPTATPAATPTPSPTPTPTVTPSPTATPTATPAPTATPTPAPTATPTPAPTTTPTPAPTATPTPTPPATATPTATATPEATATPTPVPTSTPTPTPSPSVSISGTVRYCSNPVPGPVPNVTLTLTGTAAGSTLSDGSGNYTFTSLPSGGNYTVTPSKAARTPGSPNIDTVDVIAVQRHFLVLGTPLSGCRLTAADVDLNNLVNTVDVIAIQRFFLGLTTGIANTGNYQFTPVSRSYVGLVSNQTAQDYDTLVYGDAASAFVELVEGESPTAAADGTSAGEVAATVAAVSLPEVVADPSMSNFIAAVRTSATDAKNKLVGFQGDFTFNERVVTFQSEPVRKAGITGGNWNVLGNVLPGTGPIRTLRLSAYSNDFTPLSGSGTLFELRMLRVSKAAQGTRLIWAAPPDQFIFIDADLKTQKPGNAVPGSVTPSGKRK